jgi:hypothetical protein
MLGGNPKSENIVCKTCIFRKPAVTIDGVLIEKYKHSDCKKFSYPNLKPDEILWDGSPCEFYQRDNNVVEP